MSEVRKFWSEVQTGLLVGDPIIRLPKWQQILKINIHQLKDAFDYHHVSAHSFRDHSHRSVTKKKNSISSSNSFIAVFCSIPPAHGVLLHLLCTSRKGGLCVGQSFCVRLTSDFTTGIDARMTWYCQAYSSAHIQVSETKARFTAWAWKHCDENHCWMRISKYLRDIRAFYFSCLVGNIGISKKKPAEVIIYKIALSLSDKLDHQTSSKIIVAAAITHKYGSVAFFFAFFLIFIFYRDRAPWLVHRVMWVYLSTILFGTRMSNDEIS